MKKKLEENGALGTRSFAELYRLLKQCEERMETLRRREPRNSRTYAAWIGENAACIARMEGIRGEIRRRKERAERAGISVFAFDRKVRIA